MFRAKIDEVVSLRGVSSITEKRFAQSLGFCHQVLSVQNDERKCKRESDKMKKRAIEIRSFKRYECLTYEKRMCDYVHLFVIQIKRQVITLRET